MKETIAQLKVYDWGGDRGSLAGIDDAIKTAQGDKEKLAAIEQALLEVLQSDAKLPAKEYGCRKLALIGTALSVPVLAGMLASSDLSDCALFALEGIPDAAAAEALRAALGETTGNTRVGVVNTLGERRDPEAVTALTEIQKGSDDVMSKAVESALRKIAEANKVVMSENEDAE